MANKGSKWNKWDLHLHTPGSYHWNGMKMSEMDDEALSEHMDKFIESVNDTDIEVFAIQDYWNFNWYRALRKYVQDNPEKLKKRILPGMELRVECPVDYRLNVHVILSDELSDQQIQNFQSELKIRVREDQTEKLSEEALRNAAKRLDADIAKKHGFEDPETLNDEQLLELGSMTAEVTRESLAEAKKQLPESKVFIMLPYDTSNGLEELDWEAHPHADNYFMQTADIFETRSQNNIDLINGHKTDKNEKIFTNFAKTLNNEKKPAVAGTDAHRFTDYGKYPLNRATWIKGECSFKGLEQIIYEPRSRVKVQELEPEPKSKQLIIDRVEYTNSRGQSEVVQINQNLNSLIGSRAQGKSNLLKNIAYSIDPEQTKYRGIDTSEFLALKDFTVYWADGSQNTLDENEDKGKGILFIPQKFLGELLYGKEPKFDEFLTDLFLNRDEFSTKLAQYKKNSDNNTIEITSEIQRLIETRNQGIEKNTILKKLGNRDGFIKELGELEQQSKQLGVDAKISEKELEDYDKLTQEIHRLEKLIKRHESDATSLEALLKEAILTSDQIYEYQLSEELLSKLVDQIELNDEAFKQEFVKAEIGRINDARKELIGTLSTVRTQAKPLQEKIKKNEALVTLTKRQAELKKNIARIAEIQGELVELRDKYVRSKERLGELYSEFEQSYDDLTVELPELNFSKIELVKHFNLPSLIKWAEEYANYHFSTEMKKDEQAKYGEANKFLQSPNEWKFTAVKLNSLIKQLMDAVLTDKLLLKVGKEKESALRSLASNRFEIDFPSSVKNPDGVKFNEMSDGEQMLALLEMIFKFDDYNYPVLLDQPEDDLDSRAISTTVVDFLKSQKQVRQIIIASHNANLVVCGDSENVIISNKSGGSRPNFKYVNGAIEEESINSEILEILEGGVEAFELRRKKIGKK